MQCRFGERLKLEVLFSWKIELEKKNEEAEQI